MMKSDASEKARVAVNEGALRLMKNKMIVLLRSKAARLDSQLPRHPEMKAKPISAGEFEEHLFSPRFGAENAGSR